MTRLIMAAVLLLSLWAQHTLTARAQTPESAPRVIVTTHLEPEQPRLGERVTLTIEVEHPSDRVVVMTRGVVRSSGLELVSTEPPMFTLRGSTQTTTFTAVLQPFSLGTVNLGSIELQVLAEDGSSEQVVAGLPALSIPSTLAPQRATLRPLKPQATIAGAPPAWLAPVTYAAGVAVVTLLVGGASLLVWRRNFGAKGAPAAQVVATVEDEARRQLDEVRSRDLLGTSDLETFYGRLSAIVRQYLEARFDFRATALTRRELERRMSAEGLDRWQTRLVSGLLERCDAAVYAKVYPPLASADHDLTLAYEIVELARPQHTHEAVPA